MGEFITFYGIKGIEIVIVVFVVAAIVALIEKILGVDTTPRIVKATRQAEAEHAAHMLNRETSTSPRMP